MEFKDLFEKKMAFSCELLSFQKGEVEFKALVEDSDVNPYGFAHGGYLFTLCDNAAGLVGYSLDSYTVSQQADIHYLSSPREKEVLIVKGKALHDGRSSKVAEVEILSLDGKLFCKSCFTLFPIGKVEG